MTQVWTWHEVYDRLQHAPDGKLYGVPRGGAVIAGLLRRAVDTPEEADVIVDDLVDSGRTKARYATYGKPFWVLYEKQASDGWIVFPWEHRDPTQDLGDTVIRQLEFIGEQPQREGLRETPRRVLATLTEMTAGYQIDPTQFLQVTFTEPCDQMVLVRRIPFASLCEHHLLPFVGHLSVGYIPRDHRVIGLSKIPRIVQAYARRLQTQERLTTQIATLLFDGLQALGVGVLMQATHSCMQLRGIKSDGQLLTSCLLGEMRKSAREEFLRLAELKE
jgi:GTP cyclohydrolase I